MGSKANINNCTIDVISTCIDDVILPHFLSSCEVICPLCSDQNKCMSFFNDATEIENRNGTRHTHMYMNMCILSSQ